VESKNTANFVCKFFMAHPPGVFSEITLRSKFEQADPQPRSG
jgi:hypothetical protein